MSGGNGLIVDCQSGERRERQLTASEADEWRAFADADREREKAEEERRVRRAEALQTAAEAAGLTPSAYAELHGLDGLLEG